MFKYYIKIAAFMHMSQLFSSNINMKGGTDDIIKCVEIIRGMTSQDIAILFSGSLKIGILIAGNAGRPGGSLGKVDGSGLDGNYNKQFNTQEESVIASWLQAEELRWNQSNPNISFDANRLFMESLGNGALPLSKYGRPWGIMYPSILLGTNGSKHTIQGRDFTVPFYDIKTGQLKMEQAANYNFAYSLDNKPLLNLPRTKTSIVDLVFVYGPNIAYNSHTLIGTGVRTKVTHYEYPRDYAVFKASVKMAFRAGIIKMIENKVNIAVLAQISGGIYSGNGRTNAQIKGEYETIINEILAEIYNNKPIGNYFEKIILPIL